MKFFTLTANTAPNLVVGEAKRDTTLSLLHVGAFGGGTLTFGVYSAAGTFYPLTDPAPVSVVGNRTIFLGKGTTFAVSLANATTPALVLGIAGEHFEFSPGIYQL